jgi:hypothetical protein
MNNRIVGVDVVPIQWPLKINMAVNEVIASDGMKVESAQLVGDRTYIVKFSRATFSEPGLDLTVAPAYIGGEGIPQWLVPDRKEEDE